jgi:hypothetical protein
VLPVAGVFAFLLATNRWTAPKVWSQDALSYGLMSRAAPGLPDGKVVGSAYSGRWIPHYLVGLLADATGAGQHTAYWIAGIAAVAALTVVAAVLLAALDLPPAIAVLLLAAFVAAPYATPRETLLAPGLLQDEVFVLGLAVCLAGLLRVHFGLVVTGALVAVAGRQTAVPVLLVVAAWILLDGHWRAGARGRVRRWEAVACVVAGLALYAVILVVTHPFTYAFGPDSPSDTIAGSWPGLHALVAHVGRTLVPFLVPLAVLAATWLVRLRAGAGRRDVGRQTWLCLALWGIIALQPLVISPDFPGFSYNEQRLAGLGLLPLWVAVALELRAALRAEIVDFDRAVLPVAAIAVALASLSHVYSSVGPRSLGQFIALQALAAAVLAGIVVLAARRPDGGEPAGAGRIAAQTPA